MFTKFWLRNVKGRYYCEDLAVDRRGVLKWVSRKHDVRMWNGFTLLRIGTSTERRGRVVNTPTSYSGGPGFDT
jgi:hypothetical protein